VILICDHQLEESPTVPSLDALIKEGNSSLLVLRKGVKDSVQLFNSVTSISQLDAERLPES